MPETSLNDAEFEDIEVNVYPSPDTPECLEESIKFIRATARVPRNGIGPGGDVISQEPNNILVRRSDGTLYVPGNDRQVVTGSVTATASQGINTAITLDLVFARQVSSTFRWVTWSLNPANRGFSMQDPQWSGTSVKLTFFRNDEWNGTPPVSFTPTTITATAFSVS